MSKTQPVHLETDPRFPSGTWVGFFLQRMHPGRNMMEMGLTFSQGSIQGEGRDWVGKFTIRGRYDLADGKCYWTKHYLGQHDVSYQGYNEGKGIWGLWDIYGMDRGGFHIWPEGMADPSQDHLTESADPPMIVEETLETSEPLASPLHLFKE